MHRLSYAERRHPLMELLSFVAAVLVALVAFFLGAVLLAVVVGLIALGALAFGARLWWLQRKVAKTQTGSAGQGEIIEAEYTVVKRTEERDRP